MPTVFYVEDEEYVIDDLQSYYNNYKPDENWHVEGFLVEGGRADEKKVIAMANACNPEAVVLDMRFDNRDWAGLDLIEPLSKVNPSRPIIVCTIHSPRRPQIRAIFEKGTWDYQPKDISPDPAFGGLPSFIPKVADKIAKAERYRFERINEPRIFHCRQWETILLPNELVGHKATMYDFLIEHPFEHNIFIMMKFRNTNVAHREIMKRVITNAGFNPILADETKIISDLYNPVVCLICSKYGIALFDYPEEGQIVNPNVCYELGMMRLQGKKCLILKSNSLRTLPSDIQQIIYEEYDESNIKDLEYKVRDWIEKLNS
jgi:CheY-like chemotaxis protein